MSESPLQSLRIHLPTMKVMGDTDSPRDEVVNLPETVIISALSEEEDQKPILNCLMETLPPSDAESEGWVPAQVDIDKRNLGKSVNHALSPSVAQQNNSSNIGNSIDMVIDDIMKTTNTGRRKRNSNRRSKPREKRKRVHAANGFETLEDAEANNLGDMTKETSPDADDDLPWKPPRRGRPRKYFDDNADNSNNSRYRRRTRVRATSVAAAMSDGHFDNNCQSPPDTEPVPSTPHATLHITPNAKPNTLPNPIANPNANPHTTPNPNGRENPTTGPGPGNDGENTVENVSTHAFTTKWLQEALTYIQKNRLVFGETSTALSTFSMENLQPQGMFNVGVYFLQLLMPTANPMDESNPTNRHFIDVIRTYKQMHLESQREWLRMQEQLSSTQSSAFESISRLQKCQELSMRGLNSLNPVHYSSFGPGSTGNAGNSYDNPFQQ